MGDEIAVLRDEYAGVVAWEFFVAYYRAAWQERSDKGVFLSSFADEEIAIAVSGRLGKRAFEWFKTPIGALGMRSAEDVLKNEPRGIIALRSLLMRMH